MPENISVKSDEVCEIARGQAVVEAKQMTDGRVLSVSASVSVSPGEIFTGEVRYSGRVRFDCIVIQDEIPVCVSTVAEFTDKLTGPDITAGADPIIVPKLLNTEAALDGGTLKLTAVVDTVAYAVVHRDFSCISETDDGVFADKKSAGYCTVVSEPHETAYVTDSVSSVKAEEVLCVASEAVVTGADCGADEVRLTGAVYTSAVLRTLDGQVAPYRIVTPFVKSLSAPGVSDGFCALPYVCVEDASATLIADGEERSIELAVTLGLFAKVLEPKACDIAVDAFCVDCETELAFSDAVLFCADKLATVTDAVDGQLTLDSDKLAPDNVLCVTNTSCAVTDTRIENGRINADGLVSGDIIYYNAEKNAVSSVAFRLPFSMPLAIQTDAQSASLSACVTDVAVKLRRGSVFDIRAELMFTAYLTSCDRLRAVESVKCGEPVKRPAATVIVHIARPGETLWQAAKALCCSPESVAEQNTAAAPYSGGERLISYCKR